MRPATYGPGEETIQSWPLSNGQQLRLTTCYFKTSKFLDLRRWWRDATGTWRPTPAGIRFNAELVEPLAEIFTDLSHRWGETGNVK